MSLSTTFALYLFKAISAVDAAIYGTFAQASYSAPRGRRCVAHYFVHEVDRTDTEIEKRCDLLGNLYMQIRVPGLVNQVSMQQGDGSGGLEDAATFDVCLSRDGLSESRLQPPGAYKNGANNCVESAANVPYYCNGAGLMMAGDLSLMIGECEVDRLYVTGLSLWLELCAPESKKEHYKSMCGFKELDQQPDVEALQIASMRQQTFLVPLMFNYSRDSFTNPSNTHNIVGLTFHSVKVKHSTTGIHSDMEALTAGRLIINHRAGSGTAVIAAATGIVAKGGDEGDVHDSGTAATQFRCGTDMQTKIRPGEEYNSRESSSVYATDSASILQKVGDSLNTEKGVYAAAATSLSATEIEQFIKYNQSASWADRAYISKQYTVTEEERAYYAGLDFERPTRVNHHDSIAIDASDLGKELRYENELSHPLTHLHYVIQDKAAMQAGNFFQYGGRVCQDAKEPQLAIRKWSEYINGEEQNNVVDAETQRILRGEAFRHPTDKLVHGSTYTNDFLAPYETATFNASRVNKHEFRITFDSSAKTQFTDGVLVSFVSTACNVFKQQGSMGGNVFAI